VDNEVQMRFQDPIREAYKTEEPIRLEELSWWVYAPKTRGIYDKVVRIPFQRVSKENLFFAIRYLEAQGVPFDIFLLTHGLPNNIVPSAGFPLISYKDLAELTGELRNLNLVFYQGCFGDSLAKDWLRAGARSVLTYAGLNRNFFYLEFFMKNYAGFKGNVRLAHQKTNQEIAARIKKSSLYKRLIQTMGMTVEEYLAEAPNPKLTEAYGGVQTQKEKPEESSGLAFIQR
ncbi:MAG: hypothetical protein K2X47_08375, partial [Bdellovibrionales bacterium]|nr:hypothetical protein [Bdellovibrionales bacterium]